MILNIDDGERKSGVLSSQIKSRKKIIIFW